MPQNKLLKVKLKIKRKTRYECALLFMNFEFVRVLSLRTSASNPFGEGGKPNTHCSEKQTSRNLIISRTTKNVIIFFSTFLNAINAI